MIQMIAAVARNRAIGFENKLLYWLPSDLKRFKQLTTGHTILMGRKTFDSLPKGALPNRRNCVLTRSQKELLGCEHLVVFGDGVNDLDMFSLCSNAICLAELGAICFRCAQARYASLRSA